MWNAARFWSSYITIRRFWIYFYVVLYLFFSFCGGYIGWSWMPPLDWCSLPVSTAQGKCPLSGTQNWTTLENKALSEMTDSNICMLERFSRIQCLWLLVMLYHCILWYSYCHFVDIEYTGWVKFVFKTTQ